MHSRKCLNNDPVTFDSCVGFGGLFPKLIHNYTNIKLYYNNYFYQVFHLWMYGHDHNNYSIIYYIHFSMYIYTYIYTFYNYSLICIDLSYISANMMSK